MLKKILIIIVVGFLIKACFSYIGSKVETLSENVTPPSRETIKQQVETLQEAPTAPKPATNSSPTTSVFAPTREEPRDPPVAPGDEQYPTVGEIDRNALVSCQTKTRYCEPASEMNFPDGDVTTFCTTYASNCLNPKDRVRKIWEEQEVFRSRYQDPREEQPVVEPENYPTNIDSHGIPQEEYPQPPTLYPTEPTQHPYYRGAGYPPGYPQEPQTYDPQQEQQPPPPVEPQYQQDYPDQYRESPDTYEDY